MTEAREQAKKNFTHVRAKLKEHIGTERPTFDATFDLVFLGEESEVFKIFQKDTHKIFESHDEFLKFLATFLLSCSHQVSTKQLFDKFSRVNMDGAMGEEDYKRMRCKIGKACIPSLEERNRVVTPTGVVPLFLQIERACNQFARDLILLGFPGNIQLALIYDKPHAQMSGFTTGIKIM